MTTEQLQQLDRAKTPAERAKLRKSFDPVDRLDKGIPTDLMLHSEIGPGAITSNEITQRLANTIGDIHVRINSPGGSVFEGIAIYNALKQRNAIVTVEGVAASIASVIAMAGKRIRMARGSFMMIHDPSGMVVGGEDAMRSMAESLAKIRSSIASIYSARTGKPTANILDLMTAETWFTAEEAVTAGFADEVLDIPAASNVMNLSRFQRVPSQVWNLINSNAVPITISTTPTEPKPDPRVKTYGNAPGIRKCPPPVKR